MEKRYTTQILNKKESDYINIRQCRLQCNEYYPRSRRHFKIINRSIYHKDKTILSVCLVELPKYEV